MVSDGRPSSGCDLQYSGQSLGYPGLRMARSSWDEYSQRRSDGCFVLVGRLRTIVQGDTWTICRRFAASERV